MTKNDQLTLQERQQRRKRVVDSHFHPHKVAIVTAVAVADVDAVAVSVAHHAAESLR